MDISLCIMVKDEARELENCLKAFQPLVNEIVLLDTASNEEVKKIAIKYKVRRFPFKWIDDFAIARNEILARAQCDWVMMVDADDFINLEALKKLQKYLDELPDTIEVISLPYIYNSSGSQKGNTAYIPRLWKRSLKLRYIYPIHEYLNLSGVKKDKMKNVNIPILHNKASENFSKSFERNLKLIKKHLKQYPTDLRMLYYLVHDSQQIKNYDDVIYGAQKYLEAKPQDSVKLFKVLIRKGKAHIEKGDFLQAQQAFLLAISIEPLLIEPYLELGDLYKKQKLFPEAEHFYRCAMLCKKPKQSFNFHNQSLYNFFAMKKLSFLLKEMGRPEKALAYAEKLIKIFPDDEKLKAHIKTLKFSL